MSIAFEFQPTANPADTIRHIGLAAAAALPVIALADGFRGASEAPTAPLDYAYWVTR